MFFVCDFYEIEALIFLPSWYLFRLFWFYYLIIEVVSPLSIIVRSFGAVFVPLDFSLDGFCSAFVLQS